MKIILKIAEELEITIKENVADDTQVRYCINLLSDLLEEIREKQTKIKHQDEIIKNYALKIDELKFVNKAISNSYKYLISNISDTD